MNVSEPPVGMYAAVEGGLLHPFSDGTTDDSLAQQLTPPIVLDIRGLQPAVFHPMPWRIVVTDAAGETHLCVSVHLTSGDRYYVIPKGKAWDVVQVKNDEWQQKPIVEVGITPA